MGQRFSETTDYLNQEIEFSYDGEEMVWKGDYSVRVFGEESDWDYMGDSEVEVKVISTDYVETWSETQENWVRIGTCPEIIEEIEFAIEKSL